MTVHIHLISGPLVHHEDFKSTRRRRRSSKLLLEERYFCSGVNVRIPPLISVGDTWILFCCKLVKYMKMIRVLGPPFKKLLCRNVELNNYLFVLRIPVQKRAVTP